MRGLKPLGGRPMARTFDPQAAELQIRAAHPSRFTRLARGPPHKADRDQGRLEFGSIRAKGPTDPSRRASSRRRAVTSWPTFTNPPAAPCLPTTGRVIPSVSAPSRRRSAA